MTRFHVLVVDDEPLAREVAVSLVRRDPEVATVAECGDGLRARQVIEDTRPDIVFLDVEMPGLGGVQLAEHFQGSGPIVVFITAFSRYAVDAFDLAATDYVLKPYLRRAVSRGTGTRQAKGARASSGRAGLSDGRRCARAPAWRARSRERAGILQYLERLSIKQGDRTIVLRTEEVVWIEAQDYCVTVHSTRGNHLVRASLSSLEGRLSPDTFVRTHRMAIVNLKHVREAHDRDGLRLVLSEGTQVGVSRSRRSHVESLLSPRLR